MANKLVKTSGRKVKVVYHDPRANQYSGGSSAPSANPGTTTNAWWHLNGGALSQYFLSMPKEERFLMQYQSCLPFDKQGRAPMTLATIQAYAYLKCSNGLTLWQNWLRFT